LAVKQASQQKISLVTIKLKSLKRMYLCETDILCGQLDINRTVSDILEYAINQCLIFVNIYIQVDSRGICTTLEYCSKSNYKQNVHMNIGTIKKVYGFMGIF
jgi:hypothetical protein